MAVKAFKRDEVSRIILTRPAVEAGENLGFLPGDLKDKTLKELDYIIPASARIIDSKHNYNVDKNMLEYTITVQTSENIANIYSISKAEAENMIRQQNIPKEGEEVQPSNPEKRPINDIRNEFENPDNKENDDKNQTGNQ